MAKAIAMWPLARLTPYARNPRTHSAEQIGKLVASIEEFGFTNPILVDAKSGIIAGHGRLEAARQLGLAEVPVIELTHLTDEQKRAYLIADNRLALDAGWDDDLLREELEALRADGFDLGLTGFTDTELAELLDSQAGLQTGNEDQAPDPPEQPVSRLGDLWLLGEHRVLCEDSRDPEAVSRLMADSRASLIVTDPPYGMNYGGGRARGDHSYNENGAIFVKAHGPIAGDDLAGVELERLVAGSLKSARSHCEPQAAAYVCATWRTYSSFERALTAAGMEIHACIVWDKGWIGLGHSHYRPRHEFILYSAGAWYADADEGDVWSISRDPASSYRHPTQKPVELVARCLANSSLPRAVVLDPFLGSGSTLVASALHSRRCFGMDVAPEYVDVAVRRWQEVTGGTAILESEGRSFAEMGRERLGSET